MEVALFYKSFDSTQLTNKAMGYYFLPKGLYKIPYIHPGTGLSIIIDPPWAIKSLKGMAVWEDENAIPIDFTTVGDNPAGEYYVCLLAKYILRGAPLVRFEIIPTANFEVHQERDYLIRFCKVTLPVGTSQITSDMIETVHDIPQSDVIPFTDPSAVAEVCTPIRVFDIKANIPHGNGKPNELVYVVEDQSFYIYNAITARFERKTHAMRSGTANFGGIDSSGNPQGIPIPLGSTLDTYRVVITPLIVSTGPPTGRHGGYVGEHSVRQEPALFTVYNTGSATTPFNWAVFF